MTLLKKVKKELHKNYGWENLNCDDKKWFIDGLIKDTLLIIDSLKTKEIKLTENWLLKYGFTKIGFNFRIFHDYGNGSIEFVLWYNQENKNYQVRASNNFYDIKTVCQLKKLYLSLVGSELQLL